MITKVFGIGRGIGACVALTLVLGAAPATMDSAAVDRRAAEWQPSGRERQWEQIGWAAGLKSGLEIARQSARPLFLFTHDGRLNVGRC